MLKEQTHRRNKSQLMNYSQSQPLKPKKKATQVVRHPKKRSSANNKKTLNPNLVNNLVNKSTKKINRKQILIQDIDQVPDEDSTDDFFCFGKGYGNNKFKQIEPYMEEIAEVPDTGSYSQRNTDQDRHNKNENKQNLGDAKNYKEEFEDKFFRLNKHQNNTHENATISLHSHRLADNYSRRSSNNSQRSQCFQTHSTVQLSRQKLKFSRSKSKGKNDSKNEIKVLRQKTQKMQKNIKMIWQCMGEIWENNHTYKQVHKKQVDFIKNFLTCK